RLLPGRVVRLGRSLALPIQATPTWEPPWLVARSGDRATGYVSSEKRRYFFFPGGVSSSWIVPTPCGARRKALLLAPLRLTKNVSSASLSLSAMTAIVMVIDVTPGAKVRVP